MPRRQLQGGLILFAIWVGVVAIGLMLTPAADGHGTHQRLGLPPCPSALLMDRPCPGCGLTTSWSALLHGNISLAFHAHLLGPPAFLVFTAAAWWGFAGWLTRQRPKSHTKLMNRLLMVSVVGFLLFGLVRFAATPHYRNAKEAMFLRYIGS